MASQNFHGASVVLRMLHRAACDSSFIAWQVAVIAIADKVERICLRRYGIRLPSSVLTNDLALISNDKPDGDSDDEEKLR